MPIVVQNAQFHLELMTPLIPMNWQNCYCPSRTVPKGQLWDVAATNPSLPPLLRQTFPSRTRPQLYVSTLVRCVVWSVVSASKQLCACSCKIEFSAKNMCLLPHMLQCRYSIVDSICSTVSGALNSRRTICLPEAARPHSGFVQQCWSSNRHFVQDHQEMVLHKFEPRVSTILSNTPVLHRMHMAYSVLLYFTVLVMT